MYPVWGGVEPDYGKWALIDLGGSPPPQLRKAENDRKAEQNRTERSNG